MAAKTLMVMGTASDVGKSVIVTGLCRTFARAGIRVAPFKSQNMSNNAAVCAGGEIGRAQAVQAEACGLEPTIEMNPVLLKVESDTDCQVVINGKARFKTGASESDYERYRAAAWPEIARSFQRLASDYELIVIEGAGGAAEINLRHRDIVNWAIAELADSKVVLVADIDKGGVFASIVGTLELLSAEERARVAGIIINKFRGDIRLLDSGLKFIHERTGVPVLGVLPFDAEISAIPQEDAASLDGFKRRLSGEIKIGVIHLPTISNYTDFSPLEDEPDVSLSYFANPGTALDQDVLIIPGTKSTISDLGWLRSSGWTRLLERHWRAGGFIVGICGGYQMLGKSIIDEAAVESAVRESDALGMLGVETYFLAPKVTARITAQTTALHSASDHRVTGYQIHSGRVRSIGGTTEPMFHVVTRDGQPADEAEGAISADGRVWGSSIHGLFDGAAFRRDFLNTVRRAKGLKPITEVGRDAAALRVARYDKLADVIEERLDVRAIARIAGIVWPAIAGIGGGD